MKRLAVITLSHRCRPEPKPFTVQARFRNTSIRPWHLGAGSNAGTHGSYLLWDPSGNVVVSARSGLFDADVPPGDSIDLKLALPALGTPGKYHLQIDLGREQHCVFHQAGNGAFAASGYVPPPAPPPPRTNTIEPSSVLPSAKSAL